MLDPVIECARFGAREAVALVDVYQLCKDSLILIGKRIGAPLGDYARLSSAQVGTRIVQTAKAQAGVDYIDTLQQAADRATEYSASARTSHTRADC